MSEKLKLYRYHIFFSYFTKIAKKNIQPPPPTPPAGFNFDICGISLYQNILCITGCQDSLGSSTVEGEPKTSCKILVCISDAWTHYSWRKNASIRPLHLNTMIFNNFWCFFSASFTSIYDGLLNFDQICSGTFCMYVCMYVCIYIYMYVCIYLFMYACMYVYIYICMYVCMYVCKYVCVYMKMYVWNSRHKSIVKMQGNKGIRNCQSISFDTKWQWISITIFVCLCTSCVLFQIYEPPFSDASDRNMEAGNMMELWPKKPLEVDSSWCWAGAFQNSVRLKKI